MPDAAPSEPPVKPAATRTYKVYDAGKLADALIGEITSDKPSTALERLGEDLNLAGRFGVVSESALHNLTTGVEPQPKRFVRPAPRTVPPPPEQAPAAAKAA